MNPILHKVQLEKVQFKINGVGGCTEDITTTVVKKRT